MVYATQSRKRARMRFSGARMGFRCQIAGSRGGFHWATAGGSRWASAHKIGFARGFEFGRRGGGDEAVGFGMVAFGRQIGPGVAFTGQRPGGAVGPAHTRLDSRAVLNLAGGGEALSLAWWHSGARLVPGWLSLGNGQGGGPLGAHKVESALFKFALWQLLL